MGSLQLFITVIHDLTASLGPLSPDDPVVGDLIDFIVIEQVVLSPANSPSPLVNYTGRFNVATAELALSVACTYSFFGEACDLPCPMGRNDSLGRYRCDGNGSRACLEGYRDMEANCTTCIPLDGCSEIGGTCTSPGECICRPGYSGRTCSENDTISTATAPSPSPTPPSLPTSSNDISAPTPTPADGFVPLPPTTIPTPFPTTAITSTAAVASTSALLGGTSLVQMSTSSIVNNFVQTLPPSTAIRLIPLTTPTPITAIPPTAFPAVPILPSPRPSNTISIVLGSVIGPLLLMIAISLIVFLLSLTLTYWKKQKRSEAKRSVNELYTLRSQPENNILVNVAAVSNQSRGGSHSDLGQSVEDLPETLSDPTYTTFLDDSGAFTQETLLEQGVVDSDQISALELGTRQKSNLHVAELKEQSIELRFQDVDSSEMSIGGDLLGSIQQSLSQVGGFSIKRLSTNNDHMDSVDLGSDYAPSFIYTDMFVEEDNSAFRTPSLSLDSEPA